MLPRTVGQNCLFMMATKTGIVVDENRVINIEITIYSLSGLSFDPCTDFECKAARFILLLESISLCPFPLFALFALKCFYAALKGSLLWGARSIY